MNDHYLGIDLGGSNLSAAVISARGRIVQYRKIETLAAEGPASVIDRILGLAEDLRRAAHLRPTQIGAACVCAPGLIDMHKGIVRYCPNLPGWRNIPLRQKLQRSLKRPVLLDNDANAAAYGEKWLGAGKGCQDVIMITLGTGVGGGIIQNGEIYHGHCDVAGELGHTTVLPDGPLCGCGNRGCLEALTSGTAIAREGSAALAAGADPGSPLARLSQGRPDAVTARLVFEAAGQGDPAAQVIVAKTARFLGIGIANLINILNPELVVIGGGVSKAGETLLAPVREEVAKRALKDALACVKIVAAKLADKAGVIGAAGIALHDRRGRSAQRGGRRI